LIQCAVDNLDNIKEALEPWLSTIGKGHAGFSIRMKHWDAFGESIVFAIADCLGYTKKHKDAIKAWMILSCFLTDCLGSASRTSPNSLMPAPRIQLYALISSGPCQNTPSS
ncbi:hypothetical protein AB6A40_003820, partial [Gnathostoma spinigerum]